MNTELLYHAHTHILPAALDLLPSRMDTVPARAMLLTIALQESRFQHRVQVGGPARGFWQFEKNGGVKGVLKNEATAVIIQPVLHTLRYSGDVAECYAAMAHNDTLACVFARLFLYQCPGSLPLKSEKDKGWQQYLSTWRPGKPHRATWDAFYAEAWRVVTTE